MGSKALTAVRRVEGAASRLPTPVKAGLKAAAARLDPVYVRLYRALTGDKRPIPPFYVRDRIASAVDISGYFYTGARVAGSLLLTLEHIGRPIREFRSVLDFGCGPGRVIQHLTGQGPALHGCDVDREAIAWAQGEHSAIRFEVNQPAPPLPFDDEAFDLIYAISVFTHIDELGQDAWLRELDRVLAPDGLVLVTVHGEQLFREHGVDAVVADRREQRRRLAMPERLSHEGLIFEPYVRSSWNESELSDVGDAYGIAFHSEGYIRERWSSVFEVGPLWPGVINYGQDLVLLHKRLTPEGGEPASAGEGVAADQG